MTRGHRPVQLFGGPQDGMNLTIPGYRKTVQVAVKARGSETIETIDEYSIDPEDPDRFLYRRTRQAAQ